MNIGYEEGEDPHPPSGRILLRPGMSWRLRVGSWLAEEEKTVTLARLLGLLALALLPAGGRRAREAGEDGDACHAVATTAAADAVWAAHLLVYDTVFEAAMREVGSTDGTGGRDEEDAREVAIEATAVRLRIPAEMVKLWLTTRDWRFDPHPRDWLLDGCALGHPPRHAQLLDLRLDWMTERMPLLSPPRFA